MMEMQRAGLDTDWPFPHPFGLTTDPDFDGHLTDTCCFFRTSGLIGVAAFSRVSFHAAAATGEYTE